jgi:hypothetical protein
MPDYNKGKIYTIRCRTDETLIYVGSTIQPLSVRIGEHKCRNKNGKYNKTLMYKTINNNWSDWYIELYEECPCDNKEQLNKREGEVIREIGTLNSDIAGRNVKEWYIDNKDRHSKKNKEWRDENKDKIAEHSKEYYNNNKNKILAYCNEWNNQNKERRTEQSKVYYINNKEKKSVYNKEYYENNKDITNEKITCECGCIIRRKNLQEHKKSQKHLNLISKINHTDIN